MDIKGYTPQCGYEGCGIDCGMKEQPPAWSWKQSWYCDKHYKKMRDKALKESRVSTLYEEDAIHSELTRDDLDVGYN